MQTDRYWFGQTSLAKEQLKNRTRQRRKSVSDPRQHSKVSLYTVRLSCSRCLALLRPWSFSQHIITWRLFWISAVCFRSQAKGSYYKTGLKLLQTAMKIWNIMEQNRWTTPFFSLKSFLKVVAWTQANTRINRLLSAVGAECLKTGYQCLQDRICQLSS